MSRAARPVRPDVIRVHLDRAEWAVVPPQEASHAWVSMGGRGKCRRALSKALIDGDGKPHGMDEKHGGWAVRMALAPICIEIVPRDRAGTRQETQVSRSIGPAG